MFVMDYVWCAVVCCVVCVMFSTSRVVLSVSRYMCFVLLIDECALRPLCCCYVYYVICCVLCALFCCIFCVTG